MRISLRKLAAPLAALAVMGTLAGCAEPAAFAPRAPGAQTGYTDRVLAPNRYRVTFTGNSVTPRETVENYLLLRAAEVALAAGYDHFVFDTRDTKARTRYSTLPDADPFYGAGFGAGFYGRGLYGGGFYGRGFYGGGWGFHPGFGYSAFGPPAQIIASTRYEAYAEIVMLKADQVAKEPRAIDAHAVVEHLEPTIAQPAQASVKVTPAT